MGRRLLLSGIKGYVLHWRFLFYSAIAGLIFFIVSKRRIIVTNRCVYLKNILGTKLVFPIDKITAYYTTEKLNMITICAIRGAIRLKMIANNQEIVDVINAQINERHELLLASRKSNNS